MATFGFGHSGSLFAKRELLGGDLGLLGGQIGPRLGEKFNTQRAEMTGGALGGLVAVVLTALWGWYMKTH